MQQDSLFPVRAQTHEHKIGQTNQDKRIKIKTNKQTKSILTLPNSQREEHLDLSLRAMMHGLLEP